MCSPLGIKENNFNVRERDYLENWSHWTLNLSLLTSSIWTCWWSVLPTKNICYLGLPQPQNFKSQLEAYEWRKPRIVNWIQQNPIPTSVAQLLESPLGDKNEAPEEAVRVKNSRGQSPSASMPHTQTASWRTGSEEPQGWQPRFPLRCRRLPVWDTEHAHTCLPIGSGPRALPAPLPHSVVLLFLSAASFIYFLFPLWIFSLFSCALSYL